MARPSKKEYSIPFSVRLSEKYIRYIAKCCDDSGIGRSEYIRKLVVKDYLSKKAKN